MKRLVILFWILAIVVGSMMLGTPNSLTFASCARPSFVANAPISVGTAPVFVAKGDFNGDGKVDLAVANRDSGDVSILLGNGDGTFQPPVTYSAGSGAYSGAYFVGVADFNGDGKQDLVVANLGASNVSILLGNGNGTFQNAVNYPVGYFPVAVAIGDFNGDGKLDLVVANNGSMKLSILYGNGNGTFQPAVDLAFSTTIQFVAAADFNGDGKLDLAVAGSGTTSISILLGNGDGTFQPPVNYGVGSAPYAIAIGDLNGDGKLDLAVANFASNNVSVLLGNGNGTFQAAVNSSVGSGPVFVSIADFNADGKPDLAVANFSSDNVSVILGNGNGTFQAPINYGGGTAPAGTAVGDFNGDGKPDLAVAFSGTNNVVVFLNNCGSACPTITIAPSLLPAAVVGQAYDQSLTASGGAPNYTFTVTGGTFPNGLGFSGSGVISGTPTTVNNYSFTVTATDANFCTGNQPYTLVVGSGSGGNTSLVLNVPAGGTVTAKTRGGGSTALTGSAIVTLNSGTAPYGTAVFSYTQNGVVVSEAGVPASVPTTRGRIFVDFRSTVPGKSDRAASGVLSINTGFAIVNRGGALAHLVLTLRDMGGTTLGTPGHATLVAGGHTALFVDQIASSGFAPDFVLPANFSTAIGFGSLEISSDQPISLLALRQTTNQRPEVLFTTTPIADMTLPTNSNPLYFPQEGDGSGIKTTIILLSTDTVNTETGNVNFIGNDGSPLSVRRVGDAAAQSSFAYSIPPGGVFRLETDGTSNPLSVGWAQAVPSGGSKSPVGAGIFGVTQGGILVSESGIPSATPTTHARIFIDTTTDASGVHVTGLAMGNPGGSSLNVNLNAFQADGITPAGSSAGPVILSANGHMAAYAPQLIVGLPASMQGVMDISASAPFVALTLRQLTNTRQPVSDTLFTAFPIADVNQPAPSPLVFPQIAEGAGFNTQFILISPAGAANTLLSFFGNDGSPLAVGKTARTDK